MSNGIFTTPVPMNEPIKSYAPGSPEKKTIKAELARQRSTKIEIPVVVGGKRLTGKKTVAVAAPHNKKLVLAECHQAGAKEIEAAIVAGLDARKEWAALPWSARAAVFLKAADLIATKYRDRLNVATMLGQSKTVFQAEIDSACELIDFLRFNAHYAEKLYQDQPISSPGVWNRMEVRGLEGFVYAITPFNFTAIAVNLPCAPALMGCSVLWKPAATSTLASYHALEILEEAGLPPGVINFVPGEAAMVSELALAHADFAGIHFTGSTATFNMLWRNVANNLDRYRSYPRLVGETGGKDFVFAHASADPLAVATALTRGAFEYQGQKCSAASRAYIASSIWPAVKQHLLAQLAEIKYGDVEDFTNFMGAVIDQRAFQKIKSYIDNAKKDANAKIIHGGNTDDSVGYFIEPTVIEVNDPRYITMTEEIFGPVLSVYVYPDKDLDAVLTICDETSPYALTGAVFATDRRVIEALSQRLQYAAGNFYINDKPTGAVVGQQPFGGGRKSGTNDKAGSYLNLLRWTTHRTIKETFVPPTDYRYPFLQER